MCCRKQVDLFRSDPHLVRLTAGAVFTGASPLVSPRSTIHQDQIHGSQSVAHTCHAHHSVGTARRHFSNSCLSLRCNVGIRDIRLSVVLDEGAEVQSPDQWSLGRSSAVYTHEQAQKSISESSDIELRFRRFTMLC